MSRHWGQKSHYGEREREFGAKCTFYASKNAVENERYTRNPAQETVLETRRGLKQRERDNDVPGFLRGFQPRILRLPELFAFTGGLR